MASELNKNIACSIEKAQKELDYKPKVTLYQGITDSLKEINLEKEFNE